MERHGNDVEAVFTWIDGITLAEYLENIRKGRRPPVSPREAVRLIHGLANAVSKLHNKEQIAHGDIQPPNVIVTDHPSRLILIDFGSAWPTEQSAFREAGDGLHRCYAPPELQREGRLSGFSADQFSVSVLFYELLTLQLPMMVWEGRPDGRNTLSGPGIRSLLQAKSVQNAATYPGHCKKGWTAL